MSFTKRIEDFTCDQCGKCVTGNGYTNHCPECLWSKHVDQNPGDRASLCNGAMEPESVRVFSGGSVRLIHKCLRCGFIRAQTAAKEDNTAHLVELSARSRTHPKTYRNPKSRQIRGKNGADEGGVPRYSDRGYEHFVLYKLLGSEMQKSEHLCISLAPRRL